jgi:hydroxyethylthiazole kinase-like uncharacterized protein yjeF
MHFKIQHGTPVFRSADIRRIETRAFAGNPPVPLMARAGLAAAELARSIAGDNGKPILVIAGPGNNGGDAFVLARHLKQWWFNVTVVFAGNGSNLPADAADAFHAWRDTGGTMVDDIPLAQDWGLIVDGLFGIGLQRDISGAYAAWIAAINSIHAPVLAIDIPSGLDADTGRVLGCAVRATHTITFIGLKAGLLTLDGPDYCGDVHADDLDLDTAGAPGAVLGSDVLNGILPPRARNTHKGSFGSTGIIGGASGMVGAVLLAGRAAYRLGAGRVYLGFIDDGAPSVDMQQPELMLRHADEVLKLDHLTCLAMGPGLGQSPDAAHYLRRALEIPLPLVLDADALNLIAAIPALAQRMAARSSPTLLTPHPAEAARLLAVSTADVQRDRIAAARLLVQKFNALVVLKGAGSVCASPEAPWRINTSGNPGMASAGMGDVLTGLIAALLAQGVEARRALDVGVHLHSAAADTCVTAGTGPIGLTASEVTDAARKIINKNN